LSGGTGLEGKWKWEVATMGSSVYNGAVFRTAGFKMGINRIEKDNKAQCGKGKVDSKVNLAEIKKTLDGVGKPKNGADKEFKALFDPISKDFNKYDNNKDGLVSTLEASGLGQLGIG
jgi:hypothetical protein